MLNWQTWFGCGQNHSVVRFTSCVLHCGGYIVVHNLPADRVLTHREGDLERTSLSPRRAGATTRLQGLLSLHGQLDMLSGRVVDNSAAFAVLHAACEMNCITSQCLTGLASSSCQRCKPLSALVTCSHVLLTLRYQSLQWRFGLRKNCPLNWQMWAIVSVYVVWHTFIGGGRAISLSVFLATFHSTALKGMRRGPSIVPSFSLQGVRCARSVLLVYI